MALVGKGEPVTLYQVGDVQEGMYVSATAVRLILTLDPVLGASFNNLLDALDGSFCSFEGGDDSSQDSVYPDPAPGGFKGMFGGTRSRAELTSFAFAGKEDCGTVKPASIISTSYSYNEADLTPFYTARQCVEYAKVCNCLPLIAHNLGLTCDVITVQLGLMGVTVLYSSGDAGVGGARGLCLLPNGTQSPTGNVFNPKFPSEWFRSKYAANGTLTCCFAGTCPYVTSVGATQVVAGHKVASIFVKSPLITDGSPLRSLIPSLRPTKSSFQAVASVTISPFLNIRSLQYKTG